MFTKSLTVLLFAYFFTFAMSGAADCINDLKVVVPEIEEICLDIKANDLTKIPEVIKDLTDALARLKKMSTECKPEDFLAALVEQSCIDDLNALVPDLTTLYNDIQSKDVTKLPEMFKTVGDAWIKVQRMTKECQPKLLQLQPQVLAITPVRSQDPNAWLQCGKDAFAAIADMISVVNNKSRTKDDISHVAVAVLVTLEDCLPQFFNISDACKTDFNGVKSDMKILVDDITSKNWLKIPEVVQRGLDLATRAKRMLADECKITKPANLMYQSFSQVKAISQDPRAWLLCGKDVVIAIGDMVVILNNQLRTKDDIIHEAVNVLTGLEDCLPLFFTVSDDCKNDIAGVKSDIKILVDDITSKNWLKIPEVVQRGLDLASRAKRVLSVECKIVKPTHVMYEEMSLIE